MPDDSPSNRRVLVVGCGYVGAALASELARRGHQVFGVRRRTAESAVLLPSGVHMLSGDITRPADLEQLPRPFDWVVNTIAAPAGGGVDEYRRTYLQGSLQLLEWLNSAPPQLYVYTSSTGVYGQDDGSWVDESSPTRPHSPTARVLVETEQLLLRACENHAFPAVILRLAGIYGPSRSYWLRQFLSGTAQIPQTDRRWMNMVHRDDIVRSICSALASAAPGDIYNVCDDEPVTTLDFFTWLAGRTGRPLPGVAFAGSTSPGRRNATNKRVSNRKLRESLRVELRYPTYREGYAAELASLS